MCFSPQTRRYEAPHTLCCSCALAPSQSASSRSLHRLWILRAGRQAATQEQGRGGVLRQNDDCAPVRGLLWRPASKRRLGLVQIESRSTSSSSCGLADWMNAVVVRIPEETSSLGADVRAAVVVTLRILLRPRLHASTPLHLTVTGWGDARCVGHLRPVVFLRPLCHLQPIVGR